MFPDPPAPWAHLPFFQSRWPGISRALAADPREILPPAPAIFRALALTPPDAVRVVILGQDPYPTPGNADGLAFSVQPGRRLPASLANIFREMEADLGCRPATGDLSHWARQGVLLLNTALSVPAGEANGHKSLGWGGLVAEVLAEVSRRPTAFICWGKTAEGLVARHMRPPETTGGTPGTGAADGMATGSVQAAAPAGGRAPARVKESGLATGLNTGHLVLASPHPSPLAAHRGFFGSRPFSRVDGWLRARGEAAIDWCGG